MLGVDRLHDIAQYLYRTSKAPDATSTISVLSKMLSDIFHSSEYQKWMIEEQYFGSTSYRGNFEIPQRFGHEWGDEKRLLGQLGLSEDNVLQVKVDKHGDRIHITDGLFVDPRARVFPFTDESALLCEFVKKKGWDTWATVLIDPACGCGHHSLSMDNIPIRASFDLSLRALAFCRINALISGTEAQLIGINDITNGLPKLVNEFVRGRILYVANMPFAIFPHDDHLNLPSSLAQDGGDRGIDLTIAAIKAIGDYAKASADRCSVRAAVLCYSLGAKRGEDHFDFEIEKIAKDILPGWESNFELLRQEKMWRVNGKKEEANPMPIDHLYRKANCIHTYPLNMSRKAEQGYRRIQDLFRRNGFDVLGYGILSCELGSN